MNNPANDLHENSDFFYQYTERKLEKVYESIDATTAKLTAILGFSGVLLRFTVDLPDWKYVFACKLTVILLLASSIILSSIGLKPKKFGNAVLPETILEPEWYRAKDEMLKLFIGREWLETIDATEKILEDRLYYLNKSIECLIGACLAFGVSILLPYIN